MLILNMIYHLFNVLNLKIRRAILLFNSWESNWQNYFLIEYTMKITTCINLLYNILLCQRIIYCMLFLIFEFNTINYNRRVRWSCTGCVLFCNQIHWFPDLLVCRHDLYLNFRKIVWFLLLICVKQVNYWLCIHPEGTRFCLFSSW